MQRRLLHVRYYTSKIGNGQPKPAQTLVAAAQKSSAADSPQPIAGSTARFSLSHFAGSRETGSRIATKAEPKIPAISEQTIL
jgi:hypothetical protein